MEEIEDKIIPDKWITMRDSLGFHKVRVYNSIKGLRMILEKRISKQGQDQDSLYLVSGLEGVGKSNLTLWGADIYGDIKGVPVPLENITRNVNELKKRIAVLKSKDFLTMDEGAELDGTRYQEKQAKELKEYFTIMRKAGFIIFICFTNPLKISTYFREDRVRGVFFIKKQGVCYYYANSPENPHLTEILERWGKDNQTRSIRLFTKYAPDFIMYFKEYKGELRTQYEARKDENIQTVFQKHGEQAQIQDDPDLMNFIEAGKYMNVDNRWVGKLVKKGELPCTLLGIHRRIKRSDADEWVAKHPKDGLYFSSAHNNDALRKGEKNFPEGENNDTNIK